MKTLVLFMGPPCVGKTELIKYVQEKHPQALVVHKKEIEKNHKNFSPKEWEKLYIDNINKMLQMSNFVIADSHHALKENRLELFSAIDTKKIKVIGVWIEDSWQNIIKRNNSKTKNDKMEEETLKFLFDYRSSPSKDEPFDDLVYIIIPANIGMSKSQPYLTTVRKALERI